MATTRNHLFIPAILVLIFVSLDFTAAQIGVFYGRNGDGLPPPSEVVAIFQRNGIKRMRIYEPFPPTLEALGGTDIELTVSAPNDQLQGLTDRASADGWVRDNIQNYPSVNFKHVVVGNEISPIRNQELVPYVVPAMQNIHDALAAAGLGRIAVSTAVETELIDPSTNYPPSKGEFKQEVKPYMQSILQFLVNTNGPLFVNIYPYFAYLGANGEVPLPYALLQPDGGQDTPDGRYDNLYYALLDVMYAAVEKTGVTSSLKDSGGVTNVQIKGGESGWSGGGTPAAAAVADQSGAAAANPQNQATYVNNLIQVVKRGTPKRPDQPIETYIFAMFDENQKPGNEDEKHFGIFETNGNTKFPINFNKLREEKVLFNLGMQLDRDVLLVSYDRISVALHIIKCLYFGKLYPF